MPKTLIDYTGKTINNRKVLKLAYHTKHNDPMWTVQCGCGFVFDSLTQDLNRPECRNCRNISHRTKPYQSLYNAFVYKSEQRFIKVNISYEEFVVFTKIDKCHYCSAPIEWLMWQTKIKGKEYKGHAYHLDRKDGTGDYTLDNVVVCCSRCNIAKNKNFSYEEWIEIGKTIKEYRENNAS